MKWIRYTLVVVCVGAVAGSLALVSCSSEPNYAREMKGEAKLARGEYLVKTMACGDCHTPGSMFGAPDSTRAFSGSELGWAGPEGVIYPRNITPDTETGLGNWEEKDIVKVIKTGQRPDGSLLSPMMPWPSYAFLTDQDAAAIAMYLMSLPAVNHRVPDRVPPGVAASTATMQMVGPPPAWDTQHLPSPTAAGGGPRSD